MTTTALLLKHPSTVPVARYVIDIVQRAPPCKQIFLICVMLEMFHSHLLLRAVHLRRWIVEMLRSRTEGVDLELLKKPAWEFRVEVIKRYGNNKSALGMANKDDAMDRWLAMADFEVVVSDADVESIVGEAALDEIFDEIERKAVAHQLSAL